MFPRYMYMYIQIWKKCYVANLHIFHGDKCMYVHVFYGVRLLGKRLCRDLMVKPLAIIVHPHMLYSYDVV